MTRTEVIMCVQPASGLLRGTSCPRLSLGTEAHQVQRPPLSGRSHPRSHLPARPPIPTGPQSAPMIAKVVVHWQSRTKPSRKLQTPAGYRNQNSLRIQFGSSGMVLPPTTDHYQPPLSSTHLHLQP